MPTVLTETRKIGTVTFTQPVEYRDNGMQVAAWYIDYRVVPGVYPVMFKPKPTAEHCVVEIDMEIVAVYTPSLFGGMPVDTGRRWPDTSRAGERAKEAILISAYALANYLYDGRRERTTLGRIHAWGGIFEIDDDIVAVPMNTQASVCRLAAL